MNCSTQSHAPAVKHCGSSFPALLALKEPRYAPRNHDVVFELPNHSHAWCWARNRIRARCHGRISCDGFSQVPGHMPYDQSSIKNHLLPAVSAKEKAAFQTHIALHYYATGTSFQRVEDGHLARAIAMLRPDGNLLPDRRKLASGLLDKCYGDIKSRVDARMSKATLRRHCHSKYE
jgi:hypothetical protein